MNVLPFITARELNRDHGLQGLHYCSLSIHCLGNPVLILKQWFGFSMFTTFSFLIHGNCFVVMKTCLPKCWLLSNQGPTVDCVTLRICLPKCCLANGHIMSQYVYELQASKCYFFHVISGRNMTLKGYILV